MHRQTLNLLLHQARYDLLAVRANRQARFTTLFIPILLLIVIVGVSGTNPIRDGGATLDPATFYARGVMTFAILAASLMGLVADIVIQRETGVLKRRRARPVPALVLTVAIGAASLSAIAYA